MEKESSRRLLSADDVSDDEVELQHHRQTRWQHLRATVTYSTLLIALAVSLMLNGFLVVNSSENRSTCNAPPDFGNLAYDKDTVFTSHDAYWDPERLSEEEMNARWDAIDTSPVAIAPTFEQAREWGLPETDPFPWDHDRGIYYIKAFHALHCVKLVRKAWLAEKKREKFTLSDAHVWHCFDSLRQDIMCNADSTPMPVNSTEHTFGNRQHLQCRDWNKLIEWTQRTEHNACYKSISDYHDFHETLELFSFCPEDSEYYPVMTQYFEKFGHKELTSYDKDNL